MTEAGGLLDSEEVDFLLSSGTGAAEKDGRPESAANQEVTMRGDLDQINLADIFQTLAMSKMEGMLRVRNPLEQREVFFREGMVRCLVPARVEVRRLGQMLIRAGLINAEQLRTALLTQKKVRRPIGHILVEEGVVTEEQVEDVANSQITEDLYNLFTWKHGSFEFYRGPCSDPLLAQRLDQLPEFDVNSVLMEVARRSDEWVLILSSVRSLDEIPVACRSVDSTNLDQDEQAVLRAVDGLLNIRELADTSLLGLFDCARIIRGFYEQGVLQPASAEQIVDVAESWLSRGEMKRALVTVQTLYDRTEDHDLDTVVVVADLLKRCGESRMAGGVLLEAAQQEDDPDRSLELVRQAKTLDPRNAEILTLLQHSLKQSATTSREELVDVTGALVDALRDDGHLEEALAIVEELEELDPGGTATLTRKARLLHRMKRPGEAIETLQTLAAIYSETRQRDQLIGVYEQILKIDHDRKDVARALKNLHAGKLGGFRRLFMTVGSILAAAAIGGWVVQGQRQTTALELLRSEVNAHLEAKEMQLALELIQQHEQSSGMTQELAEIRATVDAAIVREENRKHEAELQGWRLRLGEAGELLNNGGCIEAMALYADLMEHAPAQLRVGEALQARVTSLVAQFEKLERDLRPTLPPEPNNTMVRRDIEEALATLEDNFKEQDFQTGRGIAAASGDEHLVALVEEEDRERLLKSAHAVVEIFKEAHARRAQYQSRLDNAEVTANLEQVFQQAQKAGQAGDFALALQLYRTLVAKFPGRGALMQRFQDRVKYYSTIIRYLQIIERATAEGDFAKSRSQYRTLKREFPEEEFPAVRLPARVETTPEGARVFVNGEERGVSPLQLAYSPTTPTKIRVELNGFYPEEALLDGDAHDKVISLLARIPDWTTKVSGSVQFGPVVDSDGRVFIADRSGTITALESRTGDVIWSLKTRDLNGLLPNPLVHGDRLVVASVDGTLRSLDRMTGKLRWEKEGLPTELAPAACGSMIVLVTTKNEAVGVHSGTGSITYSVPLPGDVQAPPVAVQGRQVVTVTTDGRVSVFDGSSGKVLWADDGRVGRGVLSAPTVTPKGLVIPADDGSLTLLDTQTGRQLWRQTGLGEINLPVAYHGDVLFVAQERRMLLRSLEDGRSLGGTSAPMPWTSPPTLFADSLLAGNRAGQLYVFDMETLSPRYQILSKGRIVAPPVMLPDGVLVVAYENGRIHGFLRFP